jgi:cobyrinic acid a,c-diamide synthase
MAEAIERSVDIDSIRFLANEAPRLPMPEAEPTQAPPAQPRVRIGILKDAAFAFYYPENLAALAAHGAELVPISPLRDSELPAIDALYAGGGYPEEHAAELAANTRLRERLATRIAGGLPVWAECGGLMYLAAALRRDGARFPMVGALPFEIEQTRRPQGHGYVEASVDGENPFFACGTRLRGHEFHYSRLLGDGTAVKTALALAPGVGIGNGRDGIVAGRVFASYLHLFAPGAPAWAPAFVAAARAARTATAQTQSKIGDRRGIHYGRKRADRSGRGRLHSRAC